MKGRHIFKTTIVIMIMALTASLNVCAEEEDKDARIAELESEVAELQEQIEELEKQLADILGETDTEFSDDDMVLIDDEYIKVTYQRMYEVDYLDDVVYFEFLVENKSDMEFTVFPDSCYVNDMSADVKSGTFMTIESGKMSQNPFYIYYSQIGLSSIDEISKVEISFWIVDESFQDIEITDMVELPL